MNRSFLLIFTYYFYPTNAKAVEMETNLKMLCNFYSGFIYLFIKINFLIEINNKLSNKTKKNNFKTYSFGIHQIYRH